MPKTAKIIPLRVKHVQTKNLLDNGASNPKRHASTVRKYDTGKKLRKARLRLEARRNAYTTVALRPEYRLPGSMHK